MTRTENHLFRVDAHAHYAYPITNESMERILALSGADAACLAALPGGPRLDPTPDLLCYKHAHPNAVFVFGCLDCTAYARKGRSLGAYFAKHAKRLLDAGCDGIKLLEGKPTMRRAYPIPDFDAPCWEAFWQFAEQTRLPLLFHVNDPENFWDASRIPAFARASGWGYDENDVDNEAQYRQIRTVMERHPQLNVTFAHMFFLSADLPRLSEWMMRFPNMRVDLTPGIELYANLSATPDETRAFFTAFGERILYGTDIGGRACLDGTQTTLNERESLRRSEIETAFLAGRATVGIRADGDYLIGTEPFALIGLGLDDAALSRIYAENFYAFVGTREPRPVHPARAKRLAKQVKRALCRYARQNAVAVDLSAAMSDMEYFSYVMKE